MRGMIGDHQDEAFRYGRACLAFASVSISKDWLSGVSRLPGLFMGYELRVWVTQHTRTSSTRITSSLGQPGRRNKHFCLGCLPSQVTGLGDG